MWSDSKVQQCSMATWLPIKCFLLILVLLAGQIEGQISPSVFQCKLSSQPSGLLYTPNIPDSYFNDENYMMTNGVAANVTMSLNGFTYIFTIPSKSIQRNCSGRVMSIQYCYQAKNSDIGQTRNVFTFLSLIQEGVQFTVNSSVTIQTTPEDSICSDPRAGGIQQICCDTTFLSAIDQFQISSSTYNTFGVVIINNNVKPLVFASTVTEYRVEQYQSALGSSFSIGTIYTFTNSTQVNGSLLLLRFFIAMDAEPVTTAELVTNALTVNEPAATGEMVTNVPTVTEPVTTAELVTFVQTATEVATTGIQHLTVIAVTTAELVTIVPTVTEPVITGETVTNVPTVIEPATTGELVTNVIAVTTTELVTIVQTVTEPTTTAELVTNVPTVTEPVTTAELVTNATEVATTSELVTNVPTVTEPTTTESTTELMNDDEGAVSGRSNSKSGDGAVGGAIGVCVALLAIITVTCVVVVVVIKHRKRREVISLENAIYGVDSAQNVELRGSIVANYEYADSGPQVYSKLNHHLEGVEDWHKNVYADIGASYEVPIKVNVNPGELLDEDIYMVPANEENELYAQLHNITTGDLARHFVKLGDLLGSGQFGMVYKGVLQSAGGEVEVAVKTLKEGSEKEDRVKFLQEAAIMGQFKHPNVVTMYGVVTDGEPILLVLELLRKGDLRDHLLHMRNKDEEGSVNVDDHTLLSYCRQVASGMAYLSSKDFVHRDLAARNILVSDDEICKIADFGMSRDLMDESYYVSHGRKIPVKWTAPEALHYKKYSTASDVWSYGALLYEIWSVGHKPFESLANAQVLKLIETGSRLSPPPGCPRAIYSIMISCWNPVASQRPNFMDITQQLSLPDTKLLKWSEEDKSVHPDATKLGADLLCTQELFKDLQTQYQEGKS